MMVFRFLDENGNGSVATYPDDSNFEVQEKSGGKYDILVHLPQPVPRNELPVKGLIRSLDKEVANRCVDEIYECLKSNKADCDLIGIQKKALQENVRKNVESSNKNYRTKPSPT